MSEEKSNITAIGDEQLEAASGGVVQVGQTGKFSPRMNGVKVYEKMDTNSRVLETIDQGLQFFGTRESTAWVSIKHFPSQSLRYVLACDLNDVHPFGYTPPPFQ